MVLGRAEAHEVEEVLLVVEGHVETELFEDLGEGRVRDQILPPALHLAFALKSEPVQSLGLDTVTLKKLKDAAKKTLRIARVTVDSTPQAVQDHVLLLGCLLQITDKRLQL